MYMLDTNICIYIIKKNPKSVLNKLTSKSPDEVCISSITLGELEYGVAKSAHRTKNQEALLHFLMPLQVFNFDVEAAQAYGLVRAKLESIGRPIGAMDTLIAAHSLSVGSILVTNNIREFERVEGLQVENWA